MELVTVKNKYQVVIPYKLRKTMKIKVGDFMEVSVERGKVVLTPKKVVDDYSDLPNADDEYTPQQRKRLDAELAVAEKGPFYGPFETADGMIIHIKKALKKRSSENTKRAK